MPYPTPVTLPARPDSRRWGLPALLFSVLTILGGCGERQQASEASDAPPPSVVAVTAAARPVEEEAQFVGRVAAIDKVELRARVQGFLKERRFTEGQTVAVGDLLFRIEPDQYESIVEQRKADVEKAIADEENARAQLLRGKELLKTKNIPASQVDELQAAESIASASILQARAALAAAELDLSYTEVKAPVAGRIGLARFTVGNLVGPASGTLATIVSRDPIHVQFPLTQRELLEAKRKVAGTGGSARDVTVSARLPDGSMYDQKGRIDFVDVTTDPGTDTVTLRAEFPNPDNLLIDGQYVGIKVQASAPKSAIVLPQSALQVDQQGIFVMIIDGAGKAQIRRIQTGQDQGSEVAVTSGVKEGELVITQGIQKIRPGQVVRVTPQPKPGGSTTP